MNPISQQQRFIQELGAKNGQNTEKDAIIASALAREMTAYTNQDCFINEMIQNADDQALSDSKEVHFLLVNNKLIVHHTGRPFDEKDVKGISSYGDTENNRKTVDISK